MKNAIDISTIIVAGVLALGACSEPVTEVEVGGVIPPEAVQLPNDHLRTLVRQHFSGISNQRRGVIHNADAWRAFWAEVHAQVQPAPAVPSVNFGEKMIVFAATGTRSSGGFAIDITGVHRSGTTTYVVVTETSPGRNCGVTAALTAPVVAIELAKSDGEIVFVQRNVVHNCS